MAAANCPVPADDLPGLLHRPGEQAAVRVQRERGRQDRADDVQSAAGEDEMVPVRVAGAAGSARGLDDPAGAVEDAHLSPGTGAGFPLARVPLPGQGSTVCNRKARCEDADPGRVCANSMLSPPA